MKEEKEEKKSKRGGVERGEGIQRNGEELKRREIL